MRAGNHLRHTTSNQSLNNVASCFSQDVAYTASAAGGGGDSSSSRFRSDVTPAPRPRRGPRPTMASISNSSVVVRAATAARKPTARRWHVGKADWERAGGYGGGSSVADDVMTTRGVMKMVRGLFLRGKRDEMSFPRRSAVLYLLPSGLYLTSRTPITFSHYPPECNGLSG